jgi:isopentenyl-diphosphate delta-isomerase
LGKETENRKRQHVDLVLRKGMQYEKKTGLEKLEYEHCALPELNITDIDLSASFLGKKVRFPLIIEAMTGGYTQAGEINKNLAECAEKHGLAFALGSQRAMIEDNALTETYLIRDVAPTVPLIANIGAVQLKQYDSKVIENMVAAVDADALAVHLNPLQEAIQPEGDHDFSGICKALLAIKNCLGVPIIVKETGAGISQEVAIRLREVGVTMIDVAGAGGTSWSRVEYGRNGITPGFEEWGVPTVECVHACREVLPTIASGGIRSGIDVCKVITMGAIMAGAAYPFLKAWKNKRIEEEIRLWEQQMIITAFLTGSRNIEELRTARMIVRQQ